MASGTEPKDVVTIYYPDLAKKIGKSANIGRDDPIRFVQELMRYQSMVGITTENDVLPLLLFWGLSAGDNTISFASPYISKVIRDIYEVRRIEEKVKDKKAAIKPVYSYLIKSSIAVERNARAVEIVCIVVQMIERCGNNPRIYVPGPSWRGMYYCRKASRPAQGTQTGTFV